MIVHRLLEQSATRRPEAPALIDGARVISYAHLDQLANRFANLFRSVGVQRHDRVIIALENSIDLAAAYFGVMKAGAVAVPLPGGPKSDRLGKAVADCSPVAVVIDAATAHHLDQHHPLAAVPSVFVTGPATRAETLPSNVHPLADALNGLSDAAPSVRVIDIDLAAIIYTSGSTGEPRGVMLSHRNFVSNTRSIVSYLALTDRDRVMCVLPFYYVYGLSLLHTHIAVGGSVVIDNHFAFPNVVLRAMGEHSVTGFAGVPSTFALMLHRADLDDLSLPSLRYVTQAGGAMPIARVEEWLRRGPKVPFYVMYGATEASARLTYLDPARLRDKAGSIGKAIPNVEIAVVKEDGSPAAPLEIGELVARGANIARGYWNNPCETHAKFGPSGYRTGDLGYADEDGYLFLVGRRQDMLKVGAHRVGAKEIEDVLHDYPGMLEAAVVGAPHDLLGEVPVAFIALRNGSDPAKGSLEAFCHARLPAYKVPTRFIARAELPKLGTVGKIDKRALRDAVAGARANRPD